ncbi:MAG TPA: hypothetical protein VII61_08765, partial [Ktedonobacteraceae bacterium]
SAQTTPQTDVYGLGATLQTLLTGQEPLALLTRNIPPKRSIPQNVQTLLTCMLERDASKRPSDMDEVKQELQRLKDRLAGQRMKRIGAFAWGVLKSVFLDVLLLSLWLSLIFSFTTFFTSPFLLPYIFLALGIIVGCTAWGLHQATKSTSTRLNREEMPGVVGKYLRRSVLLAAVLGILFSFYYSSQQTTTDAILRSEELFALGMAALACIIGCLIFIGGWLGRGTRWLRSRGTSQHQTSHRVQSAPLQQQARRRP